ncbi:hypothetical protein DVH24_005381 [Malus domestica]|uniref:Uncharacterized protein n=1 Tax=Malus domestica TaxID=3750 RepID=A0A498KIT5_MALDO|nr:hypothetical protein DVH24_005381 [Malus domestica]
MSLFNTQFSFFFLTVFPLTFLLFLSLSFSLSSTNIHDLLISHGLPPGLLPNEVKSYTLSNNGELQVFLDALCLTKYENRVFFERQISSMKALLGSRVYLRSSFFFGCRSKTSSLMIQDQSSSSKKQRLGSGKNG